jgi:hypothetical protein
MNTCFHFQTDVRVFWWSMGLVLLFASWDCFAATSLLSPEKIVRQAVVEHLLQGNESLMKKEIVISSDDSKSLKDLVRNRLDPDLLRFEMVTASVSFLQSQESKSNGLLPLGPSLIGIKKPHRR